MNACASTVITISLLLLACSCTEQGTDDGTADATPQDTVSDASSGHGHAHDEVDLEPATIGELTVEFAQGHGGVAAGKEGHLVVKLPYNDSGSTIVRAWLGTEDRASSMVSLGVYAPSHDDYDIHAIAPDELPANTRWWIEIQKPDGTKIVGSTQPIF